MGMFYGSLRHTTSGRRKQSTKRKVNKSFSRVVRAAAVSSSPYRRETPQYPSASDTAGVAARVEPPQYTGTLVKGIGTMHKSNAIPIIDEEQMKDLARMRR
jgi:hypothetical protein